MDDAKLGQRAADKIAEFGGSWKFIGLFLLFICIWMAINIGNWFFDVFDHYPFILLNLILSCLAAIQAPIIMMSQNRMAEIDRRRDRLALRINQDIDRRLKEVELKLDKFIHAQTIRTVNIKNELEQLTDEADKYES